MKGSAVAMVEQLKSTRPAIISVSISGIPRNGTCKASKPALKPHFGGGVGGGGAAAAGAKGDGAGLGLGGREGLLQRLVPLLGPQGGEVGRTAEGGNRRKILDSVVGRIGI